MSLLFKSKQLLVAVEPTEYSAVSHGSLAVAGNASFLSRDAEVIAEPDMQDQGVESVGLSPVPKVPGVKSVRVRFGLNLRSASGPAQSEAHNLLRACGFRSAQLTKLVWSGAGPTVKRIRTGAILTQGSNTFMVLRDVEIPETPASEAAVLYCGKQEGMGSGATAMTDTDDITVTYQGVSQGTIDSDDIDSVTASAGFGYHLRSIPTSRITFDATGLENDVAVGDFIEGTTSKALARVAKVQVAAANAQVHIERVSGYFTAGEQVRNLTSADADIGNLAATNFEVQQAVPTLTIGLNNAGILCSASGARGNAKFTLEGGKIGRIDFEFLGKFNAAGDTPFATGVAALQRPPPTMLSNAFAMGPFNSDLTSDEQYVSADRQNCVSKIEIDCGNELELVDCALSSTGALGAQIGARTPTMSVDLEAVPESIFSWINRMLSGGMARFKWLVGGAASVPDVWSFSVKAAQPEGVPFGERKKALVTNGRFTLTRGVQDPNVFDDELVILNIFA